MKQDLSFAFYMQGLLITKYFVSNYNNGGRLKPPPIYTGDIL